MVPNCGICESHGAGFGIQDGTAGGGDTLFWNADTGREGGCGNVPRLLLVGSANGD